MAILILIAIGWYVLLLMFDYDHLLRVNCFNTIRIEFHLQVCSTRFNISYGTSIA